MELLLTSIIIIFILSTVCVTGYEMSYGCKFEDKINFYLSKENFPAETEPKFGEIPLDPVNFENEEKLGLFVEEVKNAVEYYYQDYNYDTIRPFLQFHSDFRTKHNSVLSESKSVLEGFFKTYKPEFTRYSGPVGPLVWIFESLADNVVKGHPDLSNHLYLAAVQKRDPKQEESDLNFDLNKIEYWHNPYGVIKFRVGGETPRDGFILITTFAQPIVLFKDGGSSKFPSFQNKYSNSKYPAHNFKLLNEHFVMHQFLGNENQIHYEKMIYLEKPFCSFQELTFRYSLVREKYIRISRNKDMTINAALDFNSIKEKEISLCGQSQRSDYLFTKFHLDHIDKYHHDFNNNNFSYRKVDDFKSMIRELYPNFPMSFSMNLDNTIEQLEHLYQDTLFIDTIPGIFKNINPKQSKRTSFIRTMTKTAKTCRNMFREAAEATINVEKRESNSNRIKVRFERVSPDKSQPLH